MNKLRSSRRYASAAVAALATLLAVNAPSEAAGVGGGHGVGGGAAGGHGFGAGPVGHGFAHGFDGDHGFRGEGFRHGGRFHRRFNGGVPLGPVYPYYGDNFGYYDPYYDPYSGYDPGYPAPSDDVAPNYDWYCPSYGATDASVENCPEPWVAVPR